MSSRKSDLKSDLTDLLLEEETSLPSNLNASTQEPVTIGTPEETHWLKKKHSEALAAQTKSPEAPPQSHDHRQGPTRFTQPNSPNLSAIGQSRIDQLEDEVTRLRAESEKKEISTIALRAQVEEMTKRLSDWEKRYRDMVESKDLELEFVREELGIRNSGLQQASKKVEELESRFESEFHRVRIKERELQNRLDIMKHESQSVLRHKDETILDLKKQMEQHHYEMDSYRKKNLGIHKQIEGQYEKMKRAVKALRVAAALLDGENDNALKKAE